MSLFLALTLPMIMIALLVNYTMHGTKMESGKLIRIIVMKYLIFSFLLYIMTIGNLEDKIMLSAMFCFALIAVDAIHFFIVTRLCRIIPISCQGYLEGISRCTEYLLIPLTLYGTIFVADYILQI